MESVKVFKGMDLFTKLLITLTFVCILFNITGIINSNKAFAYDKEKPLVIELTIPKDNYIFKLPITGGTDVSITWEEGTETEDFESTTDPTHVYEKAGVKKLTLAGKVGQFGYVADNPSEPSAGERIYTFTECLTKLISWGDLSCYRYGFVYCRNLEGAIPSPLDNTFEGITAGHGEMDTSHEEDTFWYSSIEGGFNNLFYHCEKITSIPEDLFESANDEVQNFSQIFSYCTSLKSIPEGLFSTNKNAITFRNVFAHCSNITKIPSGLFANNTKVWDFYGAFLDTGITSIPKDLFSKNTEAISFEKTFYACRDLESIDMSMFSKNTKARDFAYTFCYCVSLEGDITNELFANCTAITGPSSSEGVKRVGATGYGDERGYLEVGSTSYFDAFFRTFAYCPFLEDVTLNTPYIGTQMFYGDNKVVNINIGSNVKYMGMNCFYACNPGEYKSLSEVPNNYEGYYHKGEKSYTSDKLLKTNLTSSNKVAQDYSWYGDNRGDSPDTGAQVTGGPYTYDGTEHFPEITIDGEKVKLPNEKEPDGSYKVTVGGNDYYIYFNDNIDAGTGNVVIKDKDKNTVPVNGGDLKYDFKINPAKIKVTADDVTKNKGTKDPTFTYKFNEPVKGETPDFDGELARKGNKEDVGNYPDEIVQGTLKPKDNGKFKASNYEIDFEPGDLTIKEPTGPDISIEGGPYTYDGDPHRPTIKIGDEEYKPTSDDSKVTGPDGKEYEIIYEDNIDAGTGKVTIKDEDGNVVKTGTFVIKPLIIPVDWTDRSFVYDGKPHIPKGTATKGVIKGETLELKITGEQTKVGENYPAEAELIGVKGGRANIKNYQLDPDTVKTTFKITDAKQEDLDLAIYLSNGSKKKDKGNNNYYMLKEEVIYYVDWENKGKDFTNDYEVTFETPLDFDIIDSDDGEVDEEEHTITWKIKGGMVEEETQRREVRLKYTAFSKKSLSYEKIYPIDKIFVYDEEQDRASVINIIYKDEDDIDVKHIRYMWGDQDAPTFRPDDGISRAEGALVLTRIFEMDYSSVTVKGTEFKDIMDTYEEARRAIVKATNLGLIEGYSDGTYRPKAKMTRAEFMTILARYVEYNAQQDRIKGINVKDVSDSLLYKKARHWSAKYVVLLNRLNMTPKGVGFTNYEMDETILRCEVAELCNKYLMRAPVYDDGSIKLPFVDLPNNHRLFGEMVEATRPTHEDYRVTETAYELWKQ